MLGDRGTKLSKNFHSNIDPVFKLFFGVIKIEFDESDLISDLDGPLILSNKNDNNNFADLMRDCNKSYTSFFFNLT